MIQLSHYSLLLPVLVTITSSSSTPLYPSNHVNLHIDYPTPNATLHGSTLYVQWSFDLYGPKAASLFQSNNHDRASCMKVRSYPSGATVVIESCRQEHAPKLLDIPAGNMVLEIYAIDRNVPIHNHGYKLTETIQVQFNVIHHDNTYSNLSISKPKQKEIKATPSNSSTTLLRSTARTVSIHRVILSKLQQWYYEDPLFRNAMVADARDSNQLNRLLFNTDINNIDNDWENVIRSGMFGRMQPLLAYLPVKNVVWYHIKLDTKNNLIQTLGDLKSLNENSWEYQNEKRDVENENCETRLKHRSFHDTSYDLHSLHHQLITFGQNFEELALLDDAHKAKMLWNKLKNGSKWKIELYIGLSPHFDRNHLKTLCAVSEIPLELQRQSKLDGGPLFSETHRNHLPDWMYT